MSLPWTVNVQHLTSETAQHNTSSLFHIKNSVATAPERHNTIMPISSTSSNTNYCHSNEEEDAKKTPPHRSSSSHSKIDVMNMSLLSSPLFQQEDSSRQRPTTNATTVAGRQTTSGDEDTNIVLGGIEHESLLHNVSSWMREMESIHENLQMTSVRRGTTKSKTRSSCR
jgi:hypothetical protein